MPSDLPKLRAERREAIRDVQESWGDMTPPVYEVHNHIAVAQPTPGSDPPVASGGLAIGKHGIKLGKTPAWVLLVLGIVAIVAASGAYVLTH
jgi:hypothetical protein